MVSKNKILVAYTKLNAESNDLADDPIFVKIYKLFKLPDEVINWIKGGPQKNAVNAGIAGLTEAVHNSINSVMSKEMVEGIADIQEHRRIETLVDVILCKINANPELIERLNAFMKDQKIDGPAIRTHIRIAIEKSMPILNEKIQAALGAKPSPVARPGEM